MDWVSGSVNIGDPRSARAFTMPQGGCKWASLGNHLTYSESPVHMSAEDRVHI